MNNLPEIDFEGQRVAPVKGKYKCPFRCHAEGYPAPTWKTEKGFRQHMETCSCSPSGKQRKAAQDALRFTDVQQAAAEMAKRLGLSLGDEIYYTGYRVTAPTHVMRGTRRMRVRYEEERSYFGAAAKIESFSWLGSLVLNGRIPVASLCPSLAEAHASAHAQQHAYEAHLAESAALR